ncbi:MAG: hypothetical protein Q9182_005355 [Xanthomendoza sp. 2 TL-2023]
MLPSILLLIVTLLFKTTHAVPPRGPTSITGISSHVNKTTPLNFLGVDCYHLNPQTDSISLLDCQPLFTWFMTTRGNVYEPRSLWNGWRFKRPGLDPCLVIISSPVSEDFDVKISYAKIVSSAQEVLEKCQMGGADTFQGEWKVEVRRYAVKRGIGVGRVREE